MRVVLSTPGKFHTFDLARELHQHKMLAAVFTGYPHFKLQHENLPKNLIHTFPWVHAPYMRLAGYVPNTWVKHWEYLDKITLDSYSALCLPECDVFVGLSGSALITGKKAQKIGAKYVCDRGSSHIRTQEQLLREEHALWGVPYQGIDPRVIAREESEYAQADCITVPSQFNVDSFIAQGVPAHKLRKIPYGVNLSRFTPVAEPVANQFDILFVGGMSYRKGLQYLLQAYRQFSHPHKSLTLVGSTSPALIQQMKNKGLWSDDIKVLGHMPQTQLKTIMSTSHVMVLPSIEEGLAMVQAQALACGCPIISTTNTGAADLIEDGKQGFIVPIRDAQAIADKLTLLADQPHLQQQMRLAALERVKQMGGWQQYGQQAIELYRSLIA